MIDNDLLKLFLSDHAAWMAWRFEHPDVNPAFRGADLRGLNRPGAFLRGVNLYEADLSGATLPNAELQGAYLCRAKLDGATLSGSKMLEANLFEASLRGANLGCAQGGRQAVIRRYWRHLFRSSAGMLVTPTGKFDRFDGSADVAP